MTSSLWAAGLLLFLVTVGLGFQVYHLAHSNTNYVAANSSSAPTPVTDENKDGNPTQAQIDTYHDEMSKAAANKNWLLRAYEVQLRKHQDENPGQQSNDLFYQISTNKDLAKLAGLPVIEGDPHGGASFKTGLPEQSTSSATLRGDPSVQGTPVAVDLSKPLISPLSSVGLSGTSSPLASALDASTASFLPPVTSDTTKVDQVQDAADLDTPGMIAAKKDPALIDGSGLDAANSDLLVLPGETTQQAQAHQDSNMELALPMDATQLHAQEAKAMSPAGLPQTGLSTRSTETAANTQVKPLTTPEQDPNAPPAAPPPVINPVRAPIPGPFDILRR